MSLTGQNKEKNTVSDHLALHRRKLQIKVFSFGWTALSLASTCYSSKIPCFSKMETIFPDSLQPMPVCQELSQQDFCFTSHKTFHSSFPECPFLASLLCKGCCTLSPSIFNMWWSHHLQHQESGRFLFFSWWHNLHF